MKNNDTICAVSTPQGVGGIAVIRLSGERATAIVGHFVRGMAFRANEARFGLFRIEGQPLDEVVVTTFLAPHSYTGEDIVEISCHGSRFIQQRMIEALISQGARLANPGEFTQRAFLCGRYDLSQAEAVADLIDSQSAAAHRLAINQLRGGFIQKLKELRDKFMELTALLELELDFSDEDVEFADRSQLDAIVVTLETELRQLADSFRMGNAIKNGVPVAIVGRPNVGKSTLLNALLGEERAIVSPIAGTTRDTVEDTITLGGVQFRFVDTAGIRQSDDPIESAGIERSFRAIGNAQIVLFLTESDDETLPDDISLEGKTLIRLRNKIDLSPAPSADSSTLSISARQGTNLPLLKERLLACVDTDSDKTMLTNIRHYEAITNILQSLTLVKESLRQGLPADLVVIDIRDALYYLGQITGQVTSDEVLGTIFSRFCIGK